MHVEFFGDPSCPWTWMTSRWLCEASRLSDVEVRWRTFSLRRRDGGEPSDKIPDHLREVARAGQEFSSRAVRVFEAVRAQSGEAAVGELYTALGCRVFVPGRPPSPASPGLLQESLAAAGLATSLAEEADVASWDPVVQASMDEAFAVVGADAMSPVIVIDDDVRRGLCGPVLSPPPTGDEALQVWQAVLTLLREPGFYEARRTREGSPVFPSCGPAHGAPPPDELPPRPLDRP